MSFFTRAVTLALKAYPSVNSMIDGDNIVYFNYCDIGIAVQADKGLLVPVIRNAEALSMAEIEKKIIELADKARIVSSRSSRIALGRRSVILRQAWRPKPTP